MAGGDACVLAEVAAVLAEHGRLRCMPQVETQGDKIRLIIDVPAQALEGGVRALATLSLRHDLEYVVGLALVRAFASQYGIDAAALEKVLDAREKE